MKLAADQDAKKRQRTAALQDASRQSKRATCRRVLECGSPLPLSKSRDIRSAQNSFGTVRAAVLIVIPLFGLIHVICAQDAIKGIKSFVFFNPSELLKGQTNHVKTLFTGRTAQTLPNGLDLVQQPRIDHFGPEGNTNLIAISPECLLDTRRQTIQSTNVLTLSSGTNQMRIQGRGYYGQLTNMYLIFSNDVRTVLRQEIAQSVRAPGSLFGPGFIGPLPAKSAPRETNTDVIITSERAILDYQGNTAIYIGNVFVENSQTEVFSQQLTIRRNKSGEVESVLAETNVVIRNKQDHSEAIGERAFYFVKDGKETMEIKGKPAQWKQGAREGKAAMFTYDLTERIIYGYDHAMVRFPRGSINQSDWLPGRRTATNSTLSATNQALTNQVLEVNAESITSWMATPTRPNQRMLAQTNVVIIGTNDQTRATAEMAEYKEQYGTLELFGNASWQQGQRTVKGEHLLYDRTNQVFLAESNAFLRVPASEFARQGLVTSGSSTNINAAPKPPQFIEASSDHYEYRGGYLTFYDHVRGYLLEGSIPHGAGQADLLRIKMSNQVERITARRNVHLEQFPVPAPDGKAVSKKLDCESLTIDMATNNQVSRIFANTNVIVQQTRKRSEKAKATYSRLVADSVFADFFPYTNAVREMIAERDVFMMQDLRTAAGQKAIYTATNNIVELSGKPTVDAPDMRITEADVIIWDRAQQKFFVRRPTGQALAPPPNEKRLPGIK